MHRGLNYLHCCELQLPDLTPLNPMHHCSFRNIQSWKAATSNGGLLGLQGTAPFSSKGFFECKSARPTCAR